MEDHRVRIRLKSPAGTPWQSDTIFGHLCWQVAYGVIGTDIDTFLQPFRDGNPPFVMSDGFPTGLMPRPMLQDSLETARTLDQYAADKRWRKATYISVVDFLAVCRGERTQGEPYDDPWVLATTPHASISRVTSTTGEGGAFFETESAYLSSPGEIDIYLRCKHGWADKVIELLRAVSKTGYGRDKSVGLGAFEVSSIEEFDAFAKFDGANGFVSISSMVPAASDPVDARYRLRVKKGKLGEEWVQPNPFKRPLLQMEPGAVFKVHGEIKEFYGRVVKNLAPGKPEVVQNCYALAVPCAVRENSDPEE